MSQFDKIERQLKALDERFDRFGHRIRGIEESLEELLTRITAPVPITVIVAGSSIHIPGLQQGEDMSYTVARDHADEPFTLDSIVISDSEGPVTTSFTETFESDNSDVVSIDVAAGVLHFGTFGGANLTRKVMINGQEFIVASAVFNVTPGALTITGNINVPGLTPDA